MKAWKKYSTGILALALVVGMVSLLPHIHGEEFDENEYTFSEEDVSVAESDGITSEIESSAECEDLSVIESEEALESDEPLESETPLESEITSDGELDGEIEDAEDTNMQSAKLELIPRDLTADEKNDVVKLDIWYCECDYTITNAEGETCRIVNEVPAGGDMEVELCARYSGFTFRKYAIPTSAYYVLTGDFGDKEIMIEWDGDDIVTFRGSGVESVLITKDGIRVQGTNMNCEILRNMPEEPGVSRYTALQITNASRAVLFLQDGVFKGWADGAYTMQVADLLKSNQVVSSVNVAANCVYSVSNVNSNSPQFALVEEAE